MAKAIYVSAREVRCVILLGKASIPISVAVLFCLVTISGCHKGSQKAHEKTHLWGPDFSSRLDKAIADSSSDQLLTIINTPTRVSLQPSQIASVTKLVIAEDKSIFVLDADATTIWHLDQTGRLLNTIGSVGKRPGQFMFPTDIRLIGSLVVVADFMPRRISYFTGQGQFVQSFVYTPQQFAATRISDDPVTRNIILFGNRWRESDTGSVRTADLIHQYSNTGTFKQSSFQISYDAAKLSLTSDDAPSVTQDDQNRSLFILPFDYHVYAIEHDGYTHVLLNPSAKQLHFRPPNQPLNLTGSDDKTATPLFHSWELTWTPIVALAVDRNYLLVQYQTFDPLRYRIDIWDRSTQTLKRSVATNHLLLGVTADHTLLFLDGISNQGASQYGLLETTFR